MSLQTGAAMTELLAKISLVVWLAGEAITVPKWPADTSLTGERQAPQLH